MVVVGNDAFHLSPYGIFAGETFTRGPLEIKAIRISAVGGGKIAARHERNLHGCKVVRIDPAHVDQRPLCLGHRVIWSYQLVHPCLAGQGLALVTATDCTTRQSRESTQGPVGKCEFDCLEVGQLVPYWDEKRSTCAAVTWLR